MLAKRIETFVVQKESCQACRAGGNCYDHSYVESWFGGFKKEWLYRRTYNTESELRAIVFDYIEVWYNRKRRHSALGYVSPMQFVNKTAVQH